MYRNLCDELWNISPADIFIQVDIQEKVRPWEILIQQWDDCSDPQNCLSGCWKAARNLTDPASGDVVFVVGDDNNAKQLYAYQIILMGNSELFSSSTPTRYLYLQKDFNRTGQHLQHTNNQDQEFQMKDFASSMKITRSSIIHYTIYCITFIREV